MVFVVMETTQSAPSARSDRFPSALLALLVAISLASDFFMMPAWARIAALPMVYFPLTAGHVGCTLAQGCLLSAWLAFGDQPFGQRLLRHWIVAAILYLVWVAGLWVAVQSLGQPDQFRPVSMLVGLSVPLISIAAQLPLWIARQIFGWRLIHLADPNSTSLRSSEGREEACNDAICSDQGSEFHGSGGTTLRSSAGRAEAYKDAVCSDQRLANAAPLPAPLSIRDLMAATVVVAVSLALARLAPSPDGKPIGMLWAILFAAAATVSTLTLLPVSPLLMCTPRFARGVLFASLYAAFWIALPWLIVLVAWSRGLFTPPPLPVLLGLTCLILSFTATAILAAATTRSRGYRLISGR